MKEIDPEYRKNLVEKLFDTDKGVYVYYDMENMDMLSKEDIQEYIDLYEQQKKADPSNAANYDSDIDRMNRLLQTTSKQRENAGDYSADEYMGTVLLQDTAPYRSLAGFAKFPDAALPSNTTITVYAVQDLKIFLIPSLRF